MTRELPFMRFALEEKDEPRSFWRILPRGVHAQIVEEIVGWHEAKGRSATVEVVVRMTGRRLGQHLTRMAGLPLPPSLTCDQATLFRLLPPGSAPALAREASASPDVRPLVEKGDWKAMVQEVSRMTGRALGAELSLSASRAVKIGAGLAKPWSRSRRMGA